MVTLLAYSFTVLCHSNFIFGPWLDITLTFSFWPRGQRSKVKVTEWPWPLRKYYENLNFKPKVQAGDNSYRKNLITITKHIHGWLRITSCKIEFNHLYLVSRAKRVKIGPFLPPKYQKMGINRKKGWYKFCNWWFRSTHKCTVKYQWHLCCGYCPQPALLAWNSKFCIFCKKVNVIEWPWPLTFDL